MKILVLNCGSSSVKYAYFEGGRKKECGNFQGLKGREYEKKLEGLLEKFRGKGIERIGHRVVHGGEMKEAILIDKKVEREIEKMTHAAPLHNPFNLMGIRRARKILPEARNVAVFDTGYYEGMPEKSRNYAIGRKWRERGIVRYGFHGISHHFLAEEAEKEAGKGKIITCHLGNGASITASEKGRAVDTSMGYSPCEGLAMGTRSGDVDPTLIATMQTEFKMTAKEAKNELERNSGLKGMTGSNDFRKLEEGMKKGKKECEEAFELFCYRIAKYIGAYAAAMNGVDAIVFSGGIGEKSSKARTEVCGYLKWMGGEIDEKRNRGNERIISKGKSKIKIMVIPTDEEKMIAVKTECLTGRM